MRERQRDTHTHTVREKKNRWAYNGNETEKKHTQKNVWWSTYCMCYAVCVLGSRFVCALFCSLVCKKKDKRKENGMYENKNNRRKKKSCNEPVRMRANQMYNSSTITTFFLRCFFLFLFPSFLNCYCRLCVLSFCLCRLHCSIFAWNCCIILHFSFLAGVFLLAKFVDLVLSVVCALFIARALCALLHNIRFWSDSKLCSLYADVCLCACVCVCVWLQ